MNGISKYSEMMLFKRMKFVLISFCAVLIVFAVSHLNSEKSITNNERVISAYKVVLDGEEIGIVEGKEIANEAYENVITRIQEELNKSMLIDEDLEFYVETTAPEAYTELATLEENLYTLLLSNVSDFKEKAYIIEIDDFKVAVESKEAAEEVLEAAQNRFDQSNDFTVELVTEDMEGITLEPNIVKLNKVAKDTQLVAASNTVSMTAIESEESSTDDESESDLEEETVGELVEVDFVEPVVVYSGYVKSGEVASVEEAIELVTKEHAEKKMYTIEKGDSLSVIAYNHDMALSDLLAMNPDIDENTVLQIGQEVVITVPEPELSVQTKEKVTYTETIDPPVEEVENPDKYEGYSTVIATGEDGMKEVTALVSKVNGNETDKEVINEEILIEPVPQVLEVGTKPLPTKSATGSYIRPIVGGYISSPFGYRSSGFHHGVDFATPIGTDVRASDGGKVTFAGWQYPYGYVIYIDHGNGVQTRYAHLSQILVSVGQQVGQYEKIAETGNTGVSTGPHIHFEIRFDGVATNPMNYID